jgi:NADH-quinone oxidoreductase subunit H
MPSPAHLRRVLHAAWLLLPVLLALSLCACERTAPPALITATELTPTEAELGDRLEVTGAGFPKGKTARLTFRGALHRPGEAPVAAEIEAQGPAVSAQRIELAMTESLQVMFCGKVERARHTTFHGDVEIAFPAITVGAPPVAATIPNVTLDLRPASPERSVLEARRAEAERVATFVGLSFEDTAATAGGIAVRAVLPGSRADAAGLVAGDVVTTYDGVRVLSREDMIPSGARARASLGIRREGAPDSVVDVATDGYRLAAPRDLVTGGLVLLVAAGGVLFFFAPGAGVLPWVERRLAGRVVRRASLKALFVRATSARAPLVAVAVAAMLFAAMPFGRYVVLAELDIGLLFLVSLTALATIGWLTGGFRSAAQIASFEVPAALAIACVVLLTGSTRLHEIVRAQGGAPWSWYAFRSPITFLLFALHMTSALAQSSLVPGTLGEAESEPRLAPRSALAGTVSLVAEWANVVVTAGTSAALFLGGWRLPGMTLGQEGGHLGLELLGSAVFLLKAAALVAVVAFVRRALPVVKVEQAMRVCWRWLVPAAALGLAATLGWLAWSPGATIERIFAMGTSALVALAFLRLVHRVRFTARLLAPVGRAGGAPPADNPTSAFL